MNIKEAEEWCAKNGVVARWFHVYGHVRVQLKCFGLPFTERYSLIEAVEAMKNEIEDRIKNGWDGENLGFKYNW